MVVLGILGIAIFAGYAFKKVSGLKSIRVTPVKFDPMKKIVSLEFLNPSSESVSLKSLVADISLNGSTIGSIDTTTGFEIKAASKTIVQFPVSISALGIASLAKMLLLKAKNFLSPQVRVSGSINVANVVLPFESNIALW